LGASVLIPYSLKLSTTELSVAATDYQVGFEHPQSFNKLFNVKPNKVHWISGRPSTNVFNIVSPVTAFSKD